PPILGPEALALPCSAETTGSSPLVFDLILKIGLIRGRGSRNEFGGPLYTVLSLPVANRGVSGAFSAPIDQHTGGVAEDLKEIERKLIVVRDRRGRIAISISPLK